MRISRRLCVLASLPLCPVAIGADIHVPADQPTISAALAAASPGDAIVLAPGTYAVAATIDVPLSNVSIRSASGSSGDTVLDGGGAPFACFSVSNRTAVAFEKITIQRFGCAVDAESASVTLEACRIAENAPTTISGAVACTLGSITVTSCEFDQNTSSDAGAALGVYASDAVVRDSVFTDNVTPQGAASPDFEGAAIVTGVGFNEEFELFGSTIEITGCVFARNTSDYGAAVAIQGTTATIDRCAFVSNTARVGAGVYVRTIDFGMVGLFPADAVITNSLFIDNSVETVGVFESGVGAAIGAVNATLTIASNTFHANNAEVGTTIWGDLAVSGTVRNCLFSDTPLPEFRAAVYTGAFNRTDPPSTFVDADGPDNTLGTADDDLRLAPGSPSIDAGENASVPPGLTLDYNASPRFTDDPATPDTGAGAAPIVDVGALEFVPGATPCSPADLAPPFGALDFSDVVAFLGAFAGMAPAADLAPPAGVWDFSDVVAFLSAFGAGCP